VQLTAITLPCQSLDRALDFYDRAFGLSAARREPQYAYIALNGIWLAVMEADSLAQYVGDPTAARARAIISMNLESTTSLEAVANAATTHGARLLGEPRWVEWGGYSVWLTDPDEHLWELVHNPKGFALP
jgi:catechol 2,3-dioxygenase-like lactoylglutathione lyase family enzyme